MTEPIVYTDKDMEYQEAKISFFENRISELENELEYVRTIKDSAEKTLKEEQDKVKRYEKEEDRLRGENKKLKEKLSEITMVSDDEKQSIEHILELEKENKKLKEENGKLKGKVFFRNNRISWFEGEEERLNSVINTLKKKLKNSVGFWKKKVAKLSEENRQLKHRNEVLDLSLKASVHPLVYNELVGNTETSKSTEGRNS